MNNLILLSAIITYFTSFTTLACDNNTNNGGSTKVPTNRIIAKYDGLYTDILAFKQDIEDMRRGNLTNKGRIGRKGSNKRDQQCHEFSGYMQDYREYVWNFIDTESPVIAAIDEFSTIEFKQKKWVGEALKLISLIQETHKQMEKNS